MKRLIKYVKCSKFDYVDVDHAAEMRLWSQAKNAGCETITDEQLYLVAEEEAHSVNVTDDTSNFDTIHDLCILIKKYVGGSLTNRQVDLVSKWISEGEFDSIFADNFDRWEAGAEIDEW